MKRWLLAVAIIGQFVAVAHADTPIKSIDGFEAEVRKCVLKERDPAACLGNSMQGHFSPGNEKLNAIVQQVAGVFERWLDGGRVFAMYPVKTKVLGEFFEERVYIIENSSGSVVMLETAFIHTLGNWYLHRFNLTSKSETMKEVLGVDL